MPTAAAHSPLADPVPATQPTCTVGERRTVNGHEQICSAPRQWAYQQAPQSTVIQSAPPYSPPQQ